MLFGSIPVVLCQQYSCLLKQSGNIKQPLSLVTFVKHLGADIHALKMIQILK